MKEIYESDGRTYILKKLGFDECRNILSQYTASMSYKENERAMMRLLAHIVVRLNDGREFFLKSKELINTHVDNWESLLELESKMIEYNFGIPQIHRIGIISKYAPISVNSPIGLLSTIQLIVKECKCTWETFVAFVRFSRASNYNEASTQLQNAYQASNHSHFLSSLQKYISYFKNRIWLPFFGMRLNQLHREEARDPSSNNINNLNQISCKMAGVDLQEEKQKQENSNKGSKAVNARYDQKGGYRDKKKATQEMWATGNFKSRNKCAEEASKRLGISFDTARRYLCNTPPNP